MNIFMNLIYDEIAASRDLGQIVDSIWIPKTAMVKWLSQTTSTIFFQLRTGVLVVLGDEGRTIFPQSALFAKYDKFFEYDVTELTDFVLNSPGSEIILQLRVNKNSVENRFNFSVAIDRNVFSSNTYKEYHMSY